MHRAFCTVVIKVNNGHIGRIYSIVGGLKSASRMCVHLFCLSTQPYFRMAYIGEKNGIRGSPQVGWFKKSHLYFYKV
jgi:hypothetical protein